MEVFLEKFGQQFINGLSLGSIYALIALGYTMVYGILRLINFAHGDVFMIGAYFAYFAIKNWNAPFIPAILISMAGAASLGFIIEKGAYRPLRSAPRITVLITAIGVSFLLENAGQVILGADPKFFPTVLTREELVRWKSVALSNLDLQVILTAFVLMAGLQFIVYRTKMGKAMRAVSFDTQAAALMGVNVDKVISFTFVIGSALAAAAAVLFVMSYPKIDPLMGIMPGLKAFVAAVMGGIGNIPGAMAGGILMGLAEMMVIGFISSQWRDAIAFLLLIIILLVKPTGIFGKGMVEKV